MVWVCFGAVTIGVESADTSVAGQTVVYSTSVTVVLVVIDSAGQLVTLAAHSVMVTREVEVKVEVTRGAVVAWTAVVLPAVLGARDWLKVEHADAETELEMDCAAVTGQMVV